MHLTFRRLLAGFAAALATLSLAAGPAVAGEDDDEDEVQTEARALPAPVPVQSGDSDSGAVIGAPQGGVATGAGGTAASAPDAVLLGLTSGALILLVTGRGLVLAARPGQ